MKVIDQLKKSIDEVVSPLRIDNEKVAQELLSISDSLIESNEATACKLHRLSWKLFDLIKS